MCRRVRSGSGSDTRRGYDLLARASSAVPGWWNVMARAWACETRRAPWWGLVAVALGRAAGADRLCVLGYFLATGAPLSGVVVATGAAPFSATGAPLSGVFAAAADLSTGAAGVLPWAFWAFS